MTEDGAEEDLEMLALKTGVMGPQARHAGGQQKLEDVRNSCSL